MAVIAGSCLCGAIAFEIDPTGIVLSVGCFCTNCRKVSGSQHGIYLQVRRDSFVWISGEDHVAKFESSPGNSRGFCKTCGCVAPVATTYGAIRVPGGGLDQDPGVTPGVVLFKASKAGWCGTDEAEHVFNDQGPPEFWGGIVRELLSPRTS